MNTLHATAGNETDRYTAYFVAGFYKVGLDTHQLTHFHPCEEASEQAIAEAVRAWHKAIPQRNHGWTQITQVDFVDLP